MPMSKRKVLGLSREARDHLVQLVRAILPDLGVVALEPLQEQDGVVARSCRKLRLLQRGKLYRSDSHGRRSLPFGKSQGDFPPVPVRRVFHFFSRLFNGGWAWVGLGLWSIPLERFDLQVHHCY
jgi:hypothetical protein